MVSHECLGPPPNNEMMETYGLLKETLQESGMILRGGITVKWICLCGMNVLLLLSNLLLVSFFGGGDVIVLLLNLKDVCFIENY